MRARVQRQEGYSRGTHRVLAATAYSRGTPGVPTLRGALTGGGGMHIHTYISYLCMVIDIHICVCVCVCVCVCMCVCVFVCVCLSACLRGCELMSLCVCVCVCVWACVGGQCSAALCTLGVWRYVSGTHGVLEGYSHPRGTYSRGAPGVPTLRGALPGGGGAQRCARVQRQEGYSRGTLRIPPRTQRSFGCFVQPMRDAVGSARQFGTRS
jgi:hypothetical protein